MPLRLFLAAVYGCKCVNIFILLWFAYPVADKISAFIPIIGRSALWYTPDWATGKRQDTCC